jgi:hypothetical protein
MWLEKWHKMRAGSSFSRAPKFCRPEFFKSQLPMRRSHVTSIHRLHLRRLHGFLHSSLTHTNSPRILVSSITSSSQDRIATIISPACYLIRSPYICHSPLRQTVAAPRDTVNVSVVMRLSVMAGHLYETRPIYSRSLANRSKDIAFLHEGRPPCTWW